MTKQMTDLQFTVRENVAEFDLLTRHLSILYPNGVTVPYQAMVKGFIVYRGQTVAEAILNAAIDATRDDGVQIVAVGALGAA